MKLTPVERQILNNQRVLIECKLGNSADEELLEELKNTLKLLNPDSKKKK